MTAATKAGAAIAALLLPLAHGCSSYSLDRSTARGSLDASTSIEEVPIRGFDVAVEVGDEGVSVEGELLAVDREAIWVLTESGPVALPSSTVREVLVYLRDDAGAELGGWTGAGTVSTLSHGFWLVFSAPLWLLVGIPISVNEVLSARETALPASFNVLYQFARFPQGPTPSLRRSASAGAGGPVTPVPGPPVPEPPPSPAVPSGPPPGMPPVPPPPSPDAGVQGPPPPSHDAGVPLPGAADGGPRTPTVPEGYGAGALTAPRPTGP